MSHLPKHTPKRIEARFRQRRLGRIQRFTDDNLRDAVTRAAEHFGYPPSTTEFTWWRERELELAKVAGQTNYHVPSTGPFRRRFGDWEAALLHFGYSPEELAKRLAPKNQRRGIRFDEDAVLPAGLPMAGLRQPTDKDKLPLSDDQVARLLDAYQSLARRSRYILTVRLELAGVPHRTLKQAAHPLGLSLDRIRQLQVIATEELIERVADEDADREAARAAIEQSLRLLATTATT